MSNAIVRLQKILALEKKQGYRNKSVIGGLERLGDRWQSDASKQATTQAQMALVSQIVSELKRYPTLETVPERQAMVGNLLAYADQWENAGKQESSGRIDAIQGEKPAEQESPVEQTARPSRPTEASEKIEARPQRVSSPPPHSIQPSRPTPVDAETLNTPVDRLPGVGPGYSTRLEKMGITTIGDLLWLPPRRYVDYNTLKPIYQLQYGEEITILANLWDLKKRKLSGGNRTLVTGVLGDSTATIQATWFNPYIDRQLRVGQTYLFSGKVDSYLGSLVLRNPNWEELDREFIHAGRIVPIYPLTKGISARWMRNLQKQVVENWGRNLHDHLPASVRNRAGLLPLGEALEQVHFPASQDMLKAGRRRLAFDELFLIQIGVLRQRSEWRSYPTQRYSLQENHRQAFEETLPFQFTSAQGRVSEAIGGDLNSGHPMSRLLQGDVGSGKTAVAAYAMWTAVTNGAQAAMMAPTEILAEQHYHGLRNFFEKLRLDERPVQVALLTGSLGSVEKAETLKALAAGEIDIAIGTHALIQEGVEFKNLGLAVIDEQHRFGVRQRASLRQKGAPDSNGSDSDHSGVPHLLVMSATPIPRTLSLTVFGDLDVSVIDEMPPGRQPIKTRWLPPAERERAYKFVRRQVREGHQAFIIYPLVEESEKLDAGAAVPQYEYLKSEIFPKSRLGLLHGRMKGGDKEAVMQAMQLGEIDVLVATSVVEVGIDIPNATVIIIEDAERFGLAQLHQFRGRVGRGEHPSYCILLSGATTPNAAERLRALEQSNDGFALAEKDLQLRGPGDFFGTRQSGLPDLRLAQLSDLRTLEQARAEASRLLEEDPDLAAAEHLALARRTKQFWQGEGDIS
ncbi:MAG: ATP-dependent DNA helicase RecG [Chloroflexota bacterium]|nr:ATP-dependent DNA helicase RecG [Chloroflexota bacterium]